MNAGLGINQHEGDVRVLAAATMSGGNRPQEEHYPDLCAEKA